MRLHRVVVSVFVLLAAAGAADLQVKVVDPNSSPVAGAQVQLLEAGKAKLVSVAITSPDGMALFSGVAERRYQMQVLARGFVPQTSDVAAPFALATVRLRLAPVTETVVVSATRSPAPSEAAGATVESLTAGQLQTMQSVATGEALRFLPGAVVDAAGRRGSIASLFVRGGDSRYNKVIVDDVPVNEPGGTMDFGVMPLAEADRLEFVRGAQSTLYGSDAMTSVVQIWTRTGNTSTPEFRFGADGGTFATAHGYASLAGARGRFDYNLFGDQFNTSGQGRNDDYSNSLQGANIGIELSKTVLFRLRARHSNSRTGVQNEWNFNGQRLMPPDSDQWARRNDFLASAQLIIAGPSRWQHQFTGFEYHLKRANVDGFSDPGRLFDFPFHNVNNTNRAGFEYQGDYLARSWARTTIGYQFEDENAFLGDLNSPPLTHGMRLNHAFYGQQMLTLRRLSVVAGARFVHNESFGNKGVPRVALTFTALRGGELLSGTRLRFSYATGIKESRFDEAFASGPFIIPNPRLKAEENRAFEAGILQSLLGGRYELTANYYNNRFRNQIDFAILDFNTFVGRYENINQSIAHGAEVELRGRLLSRLSLDAAYNYTSTQILEQPFAFDNLHQPGQPLLRRPKHSGSVLLTYLGRRWGGSLGGSFVGRRVDSDFLGFGIDHAAGYARVDLGGWFALTSRMSAYVNIENVLNKHYEEVTGYPALRANFRAGLRFRLGGE